MTKSDSAAFAQLLDQTIINCGVEVKVHSYSGRSMFGKQCVAVTGDRYEIQHLFTQVIVDAKDNPNKFEEYELDFEELVNHLFGPTTDNMGFDVVYYWRDLEWTTQCAASVDEREDDEEDGGE